MEFGYRHCTAGLAAGGRGSALERWASDDCLCR